jgi:hypothetical protein
LPPGKDVAMRETIGRCLCAAIVRALPSAGLEATALRQARMPAATVLWWQASVPAVEGGILPPGKTVAMRETIGKFLCAAIVRALPSAGLEATALRQARMPAATSLHLSLAPG